VSLFAGHSRDALRASFRDAWRKWCERRPLQPLEAQIAEVVARHPEYHALLQDGEGWSAFAADGERENPFLHMSLHLALQEQLATDRPNGIAAIHARLASQMNSPHAVEHRIMTVLADVLWEAQRGGRAPDEAIYLERLRRL
jgi:hypothetical protein